MARLILILLAVGAILVSAFALGQMAQALKVQTQEARLPETVQKMSYVLLIVLMFGVVTGWLGGL